MICDLIQCPRCGAGLDERAEEINCEACGQIYPRLGAIPILLADPYTYLSACMRQAGELAQRMEVTAVALEKQLRAPHVLPLTKQRCGALIDAARAQLSDIDAVMRPLLAEHQDTMVDRAAYDIPSPLVHLHYLLRDWAWPTEQADENERIFALLDAVLECVAPGRMLVVGAGGCRLAYALHRRKNANGETIVLDIDPFLFAVAHAVIRGGTVSLSEGYAEIDELRHPIRRWTLAAPEGALDPDHFRFLLADGLDPPFAAGTVDTLLTPWFIDIGPSDLRDFISAVHRVLKPGGRWANIGPLRFTQNSELADRFTREELFELASRAGFDITTWRTESVPYLVSPHTGRGKIEWIIAFSAIKSAAVRAEATNGPANWFLFRHIPIPTFPGQSLVLPRTPLNQFVLSAIDGRRTIEDLAALAVGRDVQSGVSMRQAREAIRRSLMEVHPQLQVAD